MTNTEQAEAWDGETGRHWAEHQDHYDVMLGRLTARLVAAAEISVTDRVLDIDDPDRCRLRHRAGAHGI
jgi:hypothetical protein